MAIASTRTGLSLDRWAEIIGVHPAHFNQVQLDSDASSGLCGFPILQYAWQSADRTSREGIADAIAEAEASIELWLGFPLVGRWIAGEEHTFRTQTVAAQARQKHVRYGGIEAKSLIEAARPIVYSDEDGDGFAETATVTVTTTVENAYEIEIYYPDQDGDDGFEIRNTKVTLSGGVATIVFKRWQCLKQQYLMSMIDPRAEIATDNSLFLTTVDVYRRYNDPATQIEFHTYNNLCACGGEGCQTCAYTVGGGCIRVVDGRNGLLALNSAEWSADDLVYYNTVVCRAPNRAKLYYYAGLGWRGDYTKMDPAWERAVAYYALSLLNRPICKCSHLSGIGNIWKEDLAIIEGFGGGMRTGPMASVIKACPLGTTRAAINAWRRVQQYQVGEAAIHA